MIYYIYKQNFLKMRGFFNEFYNDKFISQFIPNFKIKQISLFNQRKMFLEGCIFNKPNISKIMRVIKGKQYY